MDAKAYFMPQNPYLVCGNVTIREQITFPNLEDVTCLDQDLELKHLLQKLLPQLLEATNGDFDGIPSKDWINKLSPGEKQTLAFLRLFFHQPKLAFLDEASSALSVETEAQLYTECQRRNIQLVSIGHRPSLKQFHQLVLNIGLDEEGSWNIETLELPNKSD